MSFLAPLYALGALAISLPILFHLIRRTPRGKTTFSSLMFLTPSPPRITRRSRLEHWFLLLLRAMAVLLLALAFARPFFRETAQLGFLTAKDRKIAILVDTSASMRRGDIWKQIERDCQNILRDLSAADDVALFAFDEHLQKLVDFDSQSTTEAQARIATVRQQLAALRPGWGASNLGEALTQLADQMDSEADQQQSDAVLQIHLFSDLQDGSKLEALQDNEWPARVYVEVHALEQQQGNAGLQEIADRDDARSGTWRVRVSNDALGQRDLFALKWLDENDQPLPNPAASNVYVPAGQDRVIRLTPPEGRNVSGLQLTDDPFDFDNKLYLSAVPPSTVRVAYSGSDSADDMRGMRYYLQQALQSDPRRKIEFSVLEPGELAADTLQDIDLLVLAAAPPAAALTALEEFLTAGGWMVTAFRSADEAAVLPTLLGMDELQIREAEVSNYAMLSNIDFDHPLFARLADARYSDFTKIRFWKTRGIVVPSESEDIHVLASFDNGLPALLQRFRGQGGLLVMASTWSPDDSQLALSTKFIPLVAGWVNAASPLPDQPPRIYVGQQLNIPPALPTSASLMLRAPGEPAQEWKAADLADYTASAPGVYELQQGDLRQSIAVNVPPAESRTTAMDPSVLEQFGVRLGKAVGPQDLAERQRQLRDQELEKRQQVWRWLIAAALGVLVAETWIAAFTARRMNMQSAVISGVA